MPDPDYIYTDRDGDEWECLAGRWLTGATHAERVAEREIGLGRDGLPGEYGPYQKDRLAIETAEFDLYRDLPASTYEHVSVWESGDLEIQPIDGEVHLSWDDDTDDGRGVTTRHLTLGSSDVLAILAAANTFND